MKQLRKILNRFTDIKTRTLLILVGVVLIVIVGLVLTTSREVQPPQVSTDVQAARIGDIASLPGTGAYNEEYAKLQLAENQLKAQQAQKSGQAAVPRLINQQTNEQARLSFGQEFCAECVYDVQGYDQNGFDAKGYNREGYNANGYSADGFNKDGFDAEGFDRDGYDKDGFDRNGFDRNGCNREGLDINGQPCYDALGYTDEGFDRFGYDEAGFDKDGFDKDGYDRNGFNKDGCNRQGLDVNGKPCYGSDGYDVNGFDKDGYDKNGFDKNGFDKDGFDKDGYGKDGFNRDGCNREGLDRQGQPCNGLVLPATTNTPQDAEAAYRKLLEEQQKARNQQVQAEQAAQDRERELAEQRAMQQAFESLLQSQSTALVDGWNPPMQVYVRGVPPTIPAEGAGGAGSGAGAGAGEQGPVLYKAGSIVFAVLDTALNSDEPGPVLATIVQGPLQGSKVMGDLQLVDKKLMLRFHLLSSPDLPASVPFEAVAIDGETARTALATGVDNHYFLRYGSLFASAFLEGIGEAVLAGITQPVLEVDNEVLVVQSADVTAGQALLVGAGTVGQAFGEHVGELFNKPPTVTVDSGTGIGLLFMQDFILNEGMVNPQPAGTVAQAELTKVSEQQNSSAQVR
jgi:type IV secretory pathway VirB10-like protein